MTWQQGLPQPIELGKVLYKRGLTNRRLLGVTWQPNTLHNELKEGTTKKRFKELKVGGEDLATSPPPPITDRADGTGQKRFKDTKAGWEDLVTRPPPRIERADGTVSKQFKEPEVGRDGLATRPLSTN